MGDDPTRSNRSLAFQSMRRAVSVGLLVIVAGLGQLRAAETDGDCRGPANDCVAVGHWNFSVALGAGVRTNPLVSGKDVPLVVVPHISYYGRRVFIDNLDLGVSLLETDVNAISLIATPGYDRVYFFRSDLQNVFIGFPAGGSTPVIVGVSTPGAVKVSPSTPRVTYLAGPEWTFEYGSVSGQLDLLRDATGQNSGSEVRGALGMPLFKSKGTVSGNLGFTWKSAATVNYYYRVAQLYSGAAAFDPFVALRYTRPLSNKWRFNAFAEYEHLGKGIADSPMVAKREVLTVFAGLTYEF